MSLTLPIVNIFRDWTVWMTHRREFGWSPVERAGLWPVQWWASASRSGSSPSFHSARSASFTPETPLGNYCAVELSQHAVFTRILYIMNRQETNRLTNCRKRESVPGCGCTRGGSLVYKPPGRHFTHRLKPWRWRPTLPSCAAETLTIIPSE